MKRGLVRKCYKDSVKLKRNAQIDEPMKDDHLKVNLTDIDPGKDMIEDSLTHIEDIKKVQIGVQAPKITHIGFNLYSEKETKII